MTTSPIYGPATWYGYNAAGEQVGVFPSQASADAALAQRSVASIAPAVQPGAVECLVTPNSDAVSLWDCPCAECTHLDWEAHVLDGWRGTLTAWRKAHFPEVWS